MKRLTIKIPDEMWAKLQAQTKLCGCGSVSAHVRHLLAPRL